MWQEAGLRARGRQGRERLNSSVCHSSSQPRLLQQLPGSCCHLLMRGRRAQGSTGRMEITPWHRRGTHPRDWNGRLSSHSKNLPLKRSKAGLKLEVLYSVSCSAVEHLEQPQAPPWGFFELRFPALICHGKKPFPAVRSTLNPCDAGPHHHTVPL